MTEVLKVLGTILVAMITTFGGGYFVLKKYLLEREDAKDSRLLQKQIDDSIADARKQISIEIQEAVKQGIIDCGVIGDKAIRQTEDDFIHKLEDGLQARSEEGRKRFEYNSKQIEQNTEQIKELTELVKDQVKKIDLFAESMASLGKVVRASADSQRNSNYDRLLFVANKVFKSGKLTITEKTNLMQLYNSWKDLQGIDPKIDTLYKECMKLTPVPDESV